MKRIFISSVMALSLVGCGNISIGSSNDKEQEISIKDHKTIKSATNDALLKSGDHMLTSKINSNGTSIIVFGTDESGSNFYKVDIKSFKVLKKVKANYVLDSDRVSIKEPINEWQYRVKVTHQDETSSRYLLDIRDMSVSDDNDVDNHKGEKYEGDRTTTDKNKIRVDKDDNVFSALGDVKSFSYSPKKYGAFLVMKKDENEVLKLYGMEDPENPKYEYTIATAKSIDNVEALGNFKIKFDADSKSVEYDYLNKEVVSGNITDEVDDSNNSNGSDKVDSSGDSNSSVRDQVKSDLKRLDKEELVYFEKLNDKFIAVSESSFKKATYLMVYSQDGSKAKYEYLISSYPAISGNQNYKDLTVDEATSSLSYSEGNITVNYNIETKEYFQK